MVEASSDKPIGLVRESIPVSGGLLLAEVSGALGNMILEAVPGFGVFFANTIGGTLSKVGIKVGVTGIFQTIARRRGSPNMRAAAIGAASSVPIELLDGTLALIDDVRGNAYGRSLGRITSKARAAGRTRASDFREGRTAPRANLI